MERILQCLQTRTAINVCINYDNHQWQTRRDFKFNQYYFIQPWQRLLDFASVSNWIEIACLSKYNFTIPNDLIFTVEFQWLDATFSIAKKSSLSLFVCLLSQRRSVGMGQRGQCTTGSTMYTLGVNPLLCDQIHVNSVLTII